MNFDVGHGHIYIGRENGKKEQGQAPAGDDLDLTMRNKQTDSAQQFEDTAELNGE